MTNNGWLYKRVIVVGGDDDSLIGLDGVVNESHCHTLIIETCDSTFKVMTSNITEFTNPLLLQNLQKSPQLNNKIGFLIISEKTKIETDGEDRIPIFVPDTKQCISIKKQNTTRVIKRGTATCLSTQWNGHKSYEAVNCLKGFRIIDSSCGMSHTAVVTSTGRLFCWGSNEVGQGPGYYHPSQITTPSEILICSKIEAVCCGASHTVVITSQNKVFAWGANGQGQLGQGHTNTVTSIVEIKFKTSTDVTSSIRGIACGIGHNIAVDINNNLWGWGWNHSGQLGDETRDNIISPKILLFNISVASCGGAHTMAINTSGELSGTGSNACGQLGLGHRNNCTSWETITSLQTNNALVRCGEEFTIVISTDRVTHSTGLNITGQLGTGEVTTSECLFKPVLTKTSFELLACTQGL